MRRLRPWLHRPRTKHRPRNRARKSPWMWKRSDKSICGLLPASARAASPADAARVILQRRTSFLSMHRPHDQTQRDRDERGGDEESVEGASPQTTWPVLQIERLGASHGSCRLQTIQWTLAIKYANSE